MRINLIIIFSTFLLLQVNANGFAQRVTIREKNTSLEDVLTAVTQQTGMNVLCDGELITKAPSLDVNFRNATMAEVFQKFYPGNNFSFSTRNNSVVVSRSVDLVFANEVEKLADIKGKVTDEKGLPLPGAAVKVKGTTQAMSTDVNGEFNLKDVPTDAILVISYTGFVSQELPVSRSTYINVVLKEDLLELSAVVVVGYGTQKKENLTGAVSQISGDDLQVRPTPNIITSLQGALPGLNIQSNNGNPGDAPEINIRGFNSINGGSPLVLIDGIQGNIDRVNPLDVESVTILKDAASSAIYGARGAFGVILVTTKKGKEGKLTVNYINNFGQTTPTNRTDYISDPYLYGKTVDAALYGYNATTYTGYNDADYEQIRKVSAGEIAPYRELQPNGTYKFYDKTDWYSYLFRKWQPTQTHNLSISGGNDKIQGYLSGRAYKSTSIQNIVDADLTKYNLKGNLNFKATDWLQISDNIQVSTDDNIEYGGGRTGYGGIFSNTTWYFLFPFYPAEIDGKSFDFFGSGAQGALRDASNYVSGSSEQLINTLSARINPLTGLQFNIEYSNTFNYNNLTTRLNQYDYLSTERITPLVGGLNRLTERRDKSNYNALNVYGTYSKSLFNQNHNIKFLAGYNQEDFKSNNLLAEQGELLVNNLSSLNLGTQLLRATGSGALWAIQGYFSRFNYDFKNKYLLEVNARYDGSSKFPEISRWGFFPSVSAGWVVSKENFYKPLEKYVSSLKLRASYGKLGNQNIADNTFSQILATGQTVWLNNSNKTNFVGAPLPLPKVVSWENSKTLDIGADLGFLDDKITASFDWFEKNIENMYLPGEPLPGVFGASEPKENIASLRNRGFEFSLGVNSRIMLGGKPLRMRASASVYNFEGVITKYPNPNGLMSTYWEGQKLGTIYGYKIDGQFKSDAEAMAYQNKFTNPSASLGQVYNYELNIVQNSQWKGLRAGDIKYLDLNGDGAINKGKNTLADHGDLAEIGNAMPKFPFGFNLNADWKSFDFSVAGTGVAKQDWYATGDIFWGPYERPYLSFIRKDLVTNAWTPENPSAPYPQIARGYAALGALRSLGEVNDYYLMNVGFMRVKNLTFGYTFPEKLTQRAKINRLRVYFSGENIFTWSFGGLTKYIDPEMAGAGINYSNPGNQVSRARAEDYPIGKSYSLGINLTL
ncbi:TonB-linked outer membrane protein, SusC/RagA family [Daejeonella lutea]|uniref:TonB-linked outer membrane protein, SusC/RagA family n=2 Tax=Daejeonella lutea TaxID=572036 RepID=A0A1T5AYD5_9SPHI|nr:TonB-linked outer membrane protein, SusC/RagA family [Daejeonella lutea]